MAGTEHARVKIGADSSPLNRDLPRAKNQLTKWAAGVKRQLGKELSGAFSALKSVAGFGGIATLAIAGRQIYDFEKKLTRLRIQSNMSAKEMADMRKQIDGVATSTGTSQDDILDAATAYVTLTGEVGQARESMAAWGKIAAATGANITDIANLSASLFQNMGIEGKDTEKVFNLMLAQGKKGAIELKDMAGIAAGSAPQFAQFGKKGAEGLAEMGAMLQIVRTGFKDTGEAATGFESLMTALAKQGKRIKAVTGVNVYDKSGKNLRNMVDIVSDLDKAISKKGIKTGAVISMLGRAEAYRALLPLMEKGREGIQSFIDLGKENELDKDFAIWNESSFGRIDKVMAKLRETFSNVLVKHADALAKAIEAVGKAVQFLADHPKGVLAVLALMKGGAFLGAAGGGLGEALGGAASGALGGGGGGGKGGGGWSSRRFTGATPGHMLQGAGIGLALAGTIGRELGPVGQSAMVVGHALAGLPGPIGLVAKGAALAGDALVLLFDHLEKQIDEQQSKIVQAKFGKYHVERAGEVLTGKGGGRSMQDLLRAAAEGGAVTAEGGLDTKKLMAQLDREGVLSGGEKAGVARATIMASRTGEGSAFLQREAARVAQEAETKKTIGLLEGGEERKQSALALEQKAEELRVKAKEQKVDVTVRVEDGRLVVTDNRRQRQP